MQKKRHRQRKLHCFQFGGGGGGGGKTKACDDVEGGGGGCHPRFLVPNEEDGRGGFLRWVARCLSLVVEISVMRVGWGCVKTNAGDGGGIKGGGLIHTLSLCTFFRAGMEFPEWTTETNGICCHLV